jgi:hypothetical protein
MHRRRAFALAVSLVAGLAPLQATAETLCRPQIALGNVQFSDVVNLRRYWTASISIDASACAASSSFFLLGFRRQSENAPDLDFTEPFIWQSRGVNVRVEFWADEAVGPYWIADIAPCPCRTK